MKKIYFIVGLLVFSGFLFAQKSDEKGIALPDLTTDVSNDVQTDGEESIPDFSKVIKSENLESNIQLQLPDVSLEGDSASVFIQSVASDKEIFAEGKIGGGIPNYFIGDFSIQQDKGKNPFKISFNHNAADGFSRHELSSGYNNTQTEVNVEKTLNFKNSSLFFGGIYEAEGDGLQSQVQDIAATNQRDINGFVQYNYSFANNLDIFGKFSGDSYRHFSDLSYSPNYQNQSAYDWVLNYTVLDISPEFNLKWQNSAYESIFNASYLFENDFKSESSINRGELWEKITWQSNFLQATGQVGVVFSNQFEQKALVPFTFGVSTALPIYFSNRKLSFAMEGGLSSQQVSVGELEKKYKFSAFSCLPKETSDWYGKWNLSVPVKSSVTVNVDAEYRHTAFENGIYEPVYDSNNIFYGVYQYQQIDRQLFKTNTDFILHYKLLSFTFGWYANWLYVPALENAQTFMVSIALQNERSLWGANLSCLYSMDAIDITPRLDFEAFVQVNNAVRLVLNVEDGIKLISGKERVYAGNYISQSGSATLLVKFFF